MRRLPVVLALVLPLAARAELTFPVPAGWVDLSPGAAEENFRDLPPEFQKTLKSGQFKAFAFDVAHTESGFTPNFNAVAMDPPIRITAERQEELTRALFGPIERGLPGAALVEKGLVEVDGVKALRIVYDSAQGGTPLRQMAVLVPGVPNSAVVTYTALRGQFAELRPAFEAHLATVRGAQEGRSRGSFDWESVLRATIVGAIGGALGGVGLKLFRKKKKQV